MFKLPPFWCKELFVVTKNSFVASTVINVPLNRSDRYSIGNGSTVVNNEIDLPCLNQIYSVEDADLVNKIVLNMFLGESTRLLASKALYSEISNALDNPEFLDSLSNRCVPEQELLLKPNIVCILIRNSSAKHGLMNNYKVVVVRLRGRSVL
ncbi:hypothetical protein BB560_006158, partial [Smittium megazygosporum]